MNDISAFEPAIPAMVVGQSFGGTPPPLGLGEPFALMGGDRLGPDGIPFAIMHDHQPALLRWVKQSCEASLAAERPWFRGSPLLLPGSHGAGRTHAARWLARVVGVPHCILNLTDPVIAANIAASRHVNEALWASPLTIAMSATRIANPVATVIGADKVSEDVSAGLATMMDPETGTCWSEDQLGITVDLGEVTWVIQCDQVSALPPALRNISTPVVLQRPPGGLDSVLTLSVMLEVMNDLRLEPTDPLYSWARIQAALPHYYFKSAKGLYADMVNALMALRQGSPDHRLEYDEQIPF
ncbi:hypothetical protein SFC76_19515 [Sphingomonas sp. CD22]|uniref:hypothetical protein n=1 Tax=Sphingomonas sp. CD22 TaxID=3100214 RepID=UPI0010E3598C|nr:hypothetical protein [Sphingomonas sp. CD22]MEA1086466.1 hypothetical protein [Sphingomonas sp. CD22]RYD29279.1 MAG: hypothetical protein EOP89_00345 [Xanthomonadaceae bacterium]